MINNIDKSRLITRIIAYVSITLYVLAFSGLIENIVLQILFGILGFVSMPLMCMFIEETYTMADRLNKTMIYAIVIAVLSAFPNRYVFYNNSSNTLYDNVCSLFSAALSTLFCLGFLIFFDKMKTKKQRIFCLLFIVAMTFIIKADCAPYMIVITYMLHRFKEEKFIKFAYFMSSFLVVIAVVSGYFLFFTDYSNKSELLRNVCMLGSIGALPIIKKYNYGVEEQRPIGIKIIHKSYYLLLLLIILFIKLLLLN